MTRPDAKPSSTPGHPGRHDTPSAKAQATEGQTKRVDQDGAPSPRLPHEHDQSADSQTPADKQPTEVGKQALKDVERGVVDTDRGPVMDKLRKKLER